MSYTTIAHCGHDHLTWLKNIDFYDDELDTLENRLVEIVKKNNGQEAMAGVEHFQNQFIVQRNNIDELRHSIHEHEGFVAEDAKLHQGRMDKRREQEHDELKERVNSFEKVINDLRQEFNLFLAKWM